MSKNLHAARMPDRDEKEGQCALCGQEARLLRSHLIPKWMYGPTAQEDRSFWSHSSKAGQRPRKVQQGLWERLLCGRCEGLFSDWEKRGKEDVLKIAAMPHHDVHEVVNGPNVDQDNLNRLGWSIFWRVAVSGRTGGGELLKRSGFLLSLASALREGSLPSREFPSFLGRFVGSGLASRVVLSPPLIEPVFGMRTFRMVAHGVGWFWTPSRRRALWASETIPWLGRSEQFRLWNWPHQDDRVEAALTLAAKRAGMIE